jgi:hypothetical protein
MTFLEYIAERLMGTPASRSSGRSTWPCPFHAPDNRPSFCTLPPKAGCKDRFRCFGCGARGDEHDLLKGFGIRDYGDRLFQLNQFREDFERDVPAADRLPISHRGERSTKPMNQTNGYNSDPRSVEVAFADLGVALNKPVPSWAVGNLAAYRLLAHAADAAWSNGITLDELALHCAEYLLAYRESLRTHAAQCDDPECGDQCRRMRGLRPLTSDEREELEQQREEAAQQRRERIARALHGVRRNGRQ